MKQKYFSHFKVIMSKNKTKGTRKDINPYSQLKNKYKPAHGAVKIHTVHSSPINKKFIFIKESSK